MIGPSGTITLYTRTFDDLKEYPVMTDSHWWRSIKEGRISLWNACFFLIAFDAAGYDVLYAAVTAVCADFFAAIGAVVCVGN